MLKLNLKHAQIDFGEAREELEKIKEVPLPDFVKFETELSELKRVTDEYQHYKNIIVLGNGGAINSFWGFYACLARNKTKKKVEILNTMERERLQEIKALYPKEETLLVVVSKSGTNPTALEAMFGLGDYPKLVICTEGEGALYEVIKREGGGYLRYPSAKEFPCLDDRQTGLSASGLGPAALVGIKVEEIYREGRERYENCAPSVPIEENLALQLATALYLGEKKGLTEVFCPVYSTKLVGFLPLLVQLMHETVGKEGKGQTFYGDLGPESQHHTNQRFFGGRRNVLGLFITIRQREGGERVEIPMELRDISLRGGILRDLEGMSYAKLLEIEFQGTFQDAVEKKIPVIHLEVEEISPKSVGHFLAFWQYVALYSAYLRGVNPFGQPQVERSKEISFELVRKY